MRDITQKILKCLKRDAKKTLMGKSERGVHQDLQITNKLNTTMHLLPAQWEGEIHVADEKAARSPRDKPAQVEIDGTTTFLNAQIDRPRKEELIFCANFLHHTFRTQRSWWKRWTLIGLGERNKQFAGYLCRLEVFDWRSLVFGDGRSYGCCSSDFKVWYGWGRSGMSVSKRMVHSLRIIKFVLF
ncbi:hypothetical protein CEXT_218181 [Caerostris extrusa]|uniref:Uncharacterized protein n=1 Tax=Caerostris extrusa TaxID=172846 RepID=A0AAV4Y1M7_CAEEX|nr:hypothetical protein CEXT_218181 [Caerostris extrusa]